MLLTRGNFFLLILTLSCFKIALAQNGHLTGLVVDSTSRSPVEFANVAIHDAVTKRPINGAVCDDKGKFIINKLLPGNYQVFISFIGFRTRKIDLIISKKMDENDLGTIVLEPVVKVLHEIVVEGQKDLVEEKVDRTVYNAENDLTTKGGDATDVLKRAPMLSVDMDGNVSLRGSQNIKVLINNKPSTIMSNSVADALKQIPADMVKAVEIITSPSSKYDAEGSAGIINIVLKKNTLEGVFLTSDVSSGTRGSSASVSSSYRKGKVGLSLGSFVRSIYNVRSNFANRQITRFNGDTLLNIQSANVHSTGFNNQYTAGLDYEINKTNSLNASVRYGQRNQFAYQDQLFTQTYQNGNLNSSTLQNVRTKTAGDNVDASLTYTKTFAKKDREFNFLGVYSRSNQNNGFVTNTFSETDNAVLRRNKNENRGYTQEIILQEDFQEPVREHQLIEFGAKQVYRTVHSDYKYFDADGANGEYVPSANRALSNALQYRQSITSGYLAYTLSLNAYTLKAGARYEYTYINAQFQQEQAIHIPSYGVLVPSVNFSRKLKNGNLIKIAYNKRIQRPNLQNLNPNLQGSNRLNATRGNPYLKPEYTDNYEIAYKTFIKNSSLNFSTYIRNNTNDIQQARSLMHDTIVSSYQNIGTEINYGLSIFATIAVSNNFSISGGTDMYYRVLKNNSNDPFINAGNRGFVRNYRLSGNYDLSNGWAVQFFGFFQGRSINLQGYQTNPITQSLSIKKDVMGKNGSIGLGIDNFATPLYKVHGELQSAYISQSTTNTLHNFILKVNFSYKLGRLQEERRKKSLTEEEN